MIEPMKNEAYFKKSQNQGIAEGEHQEA